jgi:WD repeat-containing protein 81
MGTSRHLTDNWLAYWENEIRSNDKSNTFDFKHINLLTLSGHTSNVRSLIALDNESSIISCSKDKTVRLWNLKNIASNQNKYAIIENCFIIHKLF